MLMENSLVNVSSGIYAVLAFRYRARETRTDVCALVRVASNKRSIQRANGDRFKRATLYGNPLAIVYSLKTPKEGRVYTINSVYRIRSDSFLRRMLIYANVTPDNPWEWDIL
ncbi:hypothetical protein Trydic_g13572 [Trypoxylus dichotomus]